MTISRCREFVRTLPARALAPASKGSGFYEFHGTLDIQLHGVDVTTDLKVLNAHSHMHVKRDDVDLVSVPDLQVWIELMSYPIVPSRNTEPLRVLP